MHENVAARPLPAPQPIVGVRAPLFLARSNVNPSFHFHTAAGRPLVLAFVADVATAQALLQGWQAFAGAWILRPAPWCFIVLPNELQGPELEALSAAAAPVARTVLMFDEGAIAQRYGVVPTAGMPQLFVLDRCLRGVRRFQAAPSLLWGTLAGILAGLSDDSLDDTAPVLQLPRVFEPEFCRALIAHAREHGPTPGGFMVEDAGRTVLRHDPQHKRRADTVLEQPPWREACRQRLETRLVPELARVFAFEATRVERYLVGCYSASDGGRFRAHRDNTTPGTAHRAFAVSINLNTGEYEGGGLRFPEFGDRIYAPPLGGAVVFSCSLLHEALPVTAGERWAFLPFLYGERGVAVRERNAALVASAEAPAP